MPEVDEEIVKLFPSRKTGVVETGLWRIPLYFDRAFGKNRGSVKLRRYLVMMAESGESVESMGEKMMQKYREFCQLIEGFSEDGEEIKKKRMEQLEKYFLDFIEEVGEQIQNPELRSIF